MKRKININKIKPADSFNKIRATFFNKRVGIDILVEVIGSFLIAISLYNFAVQAKFPMTGFSGIALILNRLFSLPIGITTIVLNIPVALVCYRLLGKGFFLRSLRCMIISSLMIDYVGPLLPLYEGDRLLAAICTGVLGGLGYAMIYMRNSSTGGADFIIMAVKAIRPHLSLGKIVFLTDVGIVLAGGIIFRDMDGIIYGMIINYLFAIAVDKLMYGINSGKVALIVTHHGELITDTIEECCQRGSTILNAAGGYKKEAKQVVMCACNNKQMYQLEQAVKHADPECFIIILESNEVLGEGFIIR
ncbi:YitT family protein [Lachnoclostridium phytofermentans]|nr:YitT family protein [Lachnoclostridium phytofermentans]